MSVRLDTLDMVGDGDDLDILEDVEATFGVSIDDPEAASVRTVGDLHRIVALKLDLTRPTTACFSQIAFHRIRHAAGPIGGIPLDLRPSDDVGRLFADCRTRRRRRRRWSELERRSGLSFPPLEIPRANPSLVFETRQPFLIRALMTVAAVLLSGAVWDLLGGRAVIGIGCGALVAGFVIGHARTTVPARIKTVGGLAEEAAGASFKALYAEKRSCHPRDVWFAVVSACRGSTGFRDEIRPTTSFCAHDALKS